MKIFHTADIHLGAKPDSAYPWARERELSIWNTFKRLIKKAGDEKADMLIISGDLFESQPTVAELREVDHLFSQIPETVVVLCAGNHDHITKTNPYPDFIWSKNVIGFWGRELESVAIPGLNTRVYGLSYHHYEAEENLYAGAFPEGNEKYHILLFHGGDSLHCPVKKSELNAAGFDYIAMGHIHKPGVVLRGKAAFSGALEPIDSNDRGRHGYLEVELLHGAVQMRFVDFAASIYETIEIETAAHMTLLDIEEQIKEKVLSKGVANVYRLLIKGSCSVAEFLTPERLLKYGRITEVVFEGASFFDIQKLKTAYPDSFLSRYIERLEASTDEAAQDALKIGVKAILEAMEAADDH